MSNSWKFVYPAYDPEQQPLREALCTLGNGYFATRGAFEEKKADRKSHYPGTYLSGGYNRLKSHINGKTIENEDLVNWPNWLYMTFKPENGSWLDPDQFEILDFDFRLDLEKGILIRDMRFKDPQNHITRLKSQRLVSMADKHLAGIEWIITPENWSGHFQLYAELDGDIINDGVPRYRDLNSHHLATQEKGFTEEELFYLRTRTNQSYLEMAQACALGVKKGNIQKSDQNEVTPHKIGLNLTLEGQANEPVQIEKLVSIFSNRDKALSEPTLEACKKLKRKRGFKNLLNEHERAWKHLWRRCNIDVSSNNDDGLDDPLILRFHIFHLLQTASPNSIDRDVGVPPRGWHGEAYRGHIFWDELFIFPFINLRIPQLTRSLLMYRYRRLEEARYAARKSGYKGAMFPWQSGSNGREESQVLHLNPESGRWIPDNTHLQRHVNTSIAYNVWQYYEVSQDIEFLHFYGAEMILSIMQFLESITEFNEDRGRYEIHKVVGPDEYHTKYPDADEPGLNNNAYTNFMVAWVAQKAIKTLQTLNQGKQSALKENLDINDENIDKWEDISKKLFIPFHDEIIISQFEGYENLQELDWEHYRSKYGKNFRLDRILENQNDSPNRYKASKQADVLMLFYLFSSEALNQVFDQLGYHFDPKTIPTNIHYYENRTSHGSSLSWLVHSWVTVRADREKSWNNYQQALISDVRDIQNGTTPEGIHLGAMAGTVDLMQRCYAGIEVRDDVLWLNPTLPEEIECLSFPIRYRGNWIFLTIHQKCLEVNACEGWNFPVLIGVNGKSFKFQKGDSSKFRLGKAL